MRIACILIQKDEGPLLASWLSYHGLLVGFENLYILDNGSSDPQTLQILEQFRDRGIHVDYAFDSPEDFKFKGQLVTNQILKIDRSQGRCNFYFPLDCDEFLSALGSDGRPRLERSAIHAALDGHDGYPGPIRVGCVFEVNPVHQNYYQRNLGQSKVFLAQANGGVLDNGSHRLTNSEAPEICSTISYIHFHFRKYDDYVRLAKQKLVKHTTDFSASALLDYRGQSHHVAGALMMSEEEYYCQFRLAELEELPEILAVIRKSECEAGVAPQLGTSIYNIFAAPEAVEAALSRPRGVIDFVELRGRFLRVAGWAAQSDGSAIQKLRFMLDNEMFEADQFHRTSRPDVLAAGLAKTLEVGFDCLIDIKLLPSEYNEFAVLACGSAESAVGRLTFGNPRQLDLMELKAAQSELADQLSN